MTVYNIYDETGRITQSNKLYNPEGYEASIRELGHNFVAHAGDAPNNIERFFIQSAVLTERPIMPITISKTEIQAGGSDAAVFLGIPKNAKITVTTSSMTIFSQAIPDTEFEVSIPVPCLYQITIDLWPFKTFATTIKATT